MISSVGGADGLISRQRLNIMATSALATRRWPFASGLESPRMRNHESNALVFVRPSRHDGPDHRITVDGTTLRPLSCSCQAGRHSQLCWAVIDVTATELVWRAHQRWQDACGEVDIRAAAAVLSQTHKWAHRRTRAPIAPRPRPSHQSHQSRRSGRQCRCRSSNVFRPACQLRARRCARRQFVNRRAPSHDR